MTSEHRALALKWRPVRFEDVIGQPHVVQTLSNALAQGKVANAYLFAGPRGVGKTTCARILARAVNCERGQGPNPCGECSMCMEIMSSRAIDVIEIDAASTRGIDEIRDLREVARLAPARARKKVFILDEAHMLTGPAANAFLKTLEEPPGHVMFILATTNAHDIIPTIHSRCQRFNFHPLGPATVTAHLKRIAEAEQIHVEEAAFVLIAKVSRGAMRDAQMLLEQVAAFAPGKVTVADVRALLGLVEREWVERFLTVVHSRDAKAGLALLDELIESGRNPEELLEEVQEELRDALMTKLGAEVASMTADGFLTASERAGWFSEEELLALLVHVRRAIEELTSRQISHPRIAAELAVARLMRRERALAWNEVEAHLKRLEAALQGGRSPPATNPATGRGDIPLGDLARQWPQVLERLKTSEPAGQVYLKSARVVEVKDGTVMLEVGSQFHRQGLESGEIKVSVERALSELVGQRVSIAVCAAGPETGGAAKPVVPAQPVPDWMEREPLVKAAMEIFKARFVPKHPPAQR